MPLPMPVSAAAEAASSSTCDMPKSHTCSREQQGHTRRQSVALRLAAAICGNLRQSAAICGNLRQSAAICGNLRQSSPRHIDQGDLSAC